MQEKGSHAFSKVMLFWSARRQSSLELFWSARQHHATPCTMPEVFGQRQKPASSTATHAWLDIHSLPAATQQQEQGKEEE
jgi:hypothetical protein